MKSLVISYAFLHVTWNQTHKANSRCNHHPLEKLYMPFDFVPYDSMSRSGAVARNWNSASACTGTQPRYGFRATRIKLKDHIYYLENIMGLFENFQIFRETRTEQKPSLQLGSVQRHITFFNLRILTVTFLFKKKKMQSLYKKTKGNLFYPHQDITISSATCICPEYASKHGDPKKSRKDHPLQKFEKGTFECLLVVMDTIHLIIR